jgi:hypothetical protein
VGDHSFGCIDNIYLHPIQFYGGYLDCGVGLFWHRNDLKYIYRIRERNKHALYDAKNS